MKKILQNKWLKTILWSFLYFCWVVWRGNYWFLLGLGIIFDYHITKKVKWLFWKKNYREGEERNSLLDWLDALIFAVVVVTFVNTFFVQAFLIPSSSMESSLYTGDHLYVSKLTFGPKLPQTPLTIPFTHNTIMGKKSYSTLLNRPYKRLAGLRKVRRGDCVVFGFPNGDTVLSKLPSEDYYALKRRTEVKNFVENNYGPIIVRPVDKKDHYVKRCVALPGDTLTLVDGIVHINSKKQEEPSGLQFSYRVKTNGQKINLRFLQKIGVNTSEVFFDENLSEYSSIPLTQQQYESVRLLSNVLSVVCHMDSYPPDYPDSYLTLFPHEKHFEWTRDNYGPIWIPKKGTKVVLTKENLPLYRRVISVYEGNRLRVTEEGDIIVNGIKTNEYVFKQDYYFMMGDNRHNSLDSRYWGFVPEDHIVGRPFLIWFSNIKYKSFPENIRWDRFFKFV